MMFLIETIGIILVTLNPNWNLAYTVINVEINHISIELYISLLKILMTWSRCILLDIFEKLFSFEVRHQHHSIVIFLFTCKSLPQKTKTLNILHNIYFQQNDIKISMKTCTDFLQKFVTKYSQVPSWAGCSADKESFIGKYVRSSLSMKITVICRKTFTFWTAYLKEDESI